MNTRQVVHDNVVISNVGGNDLRQSDSPVATECDLEDVATQLGENFDAASTTTLIDDTIALIGGDRPEPESEPEPESAVGGVERVVAAKNRAASAPRLFLPAVGLSIAVAFQLGIEISGQGLFFLSPPATVLLLTAMIAAGFALFLYRGWVYPAKQSAHSFANGSDDPASGGVPASADAEELSLDHITGVMKSRLLADLDKGEETVRKEKLEEELHNLRGEMDTRLCDELEKREEAIRDGILSHVEKISVFFESLFEKHVFRLNRELREKEAEISQLLTGSQVTKRQEAEKREVVEQQTAEIARLQGMVEELETELVLKESVPVSGPDIQLVSEPEPLHVDDGEPVDKVEPDCEPDSEPESEGDSALAKELRDQLGARLKAASRRATELLAENGSRGNGTGSKKNGGGGNKIASEIASELSALDRLASQVEDLEKLQTSAWKQERTEVHVQDIVKQARDYFRDVSKEKGIRVSTRFPKDLESVVVDRNLVEQALIEVIGNAIAYSNRSGRVNISATLEPDKNADRDVLCLKVKDAGRGVPKKELSRIFEPLKRGRNPRPSLTGAGLGLGLTLAKACAEELGGTLSVEGKPGKGSTFILEVPLERAAE